MSETNNKQGENMSDVNTDAAERFAQLDLDMEPKQPKEESDSEVFEKMTGQESKISKRHSYSGEQACHQHVANRLEKLPSLHDACQGLISEVEAEKRKDVEICLGDIMVDQNGNLIHNNPNDFLHVDEDVLCSLTPLPEAWRRLTQEAPKDVHTALKGNVNSWIRRKSANRIFRTFKPSESRVDRQMFGLVSKKYVTHDADQVAEKIMQAIPNDYKGSVRYNGDGGRYEISALLARPFEVKGDAHQVSISVRSADNGTGSQSIYFKMFRLLCTNGISVQDKALIMRLAHKGDADELKDQFQAGLLMAGQAIESFSYKWGRAMENQFVCDETGDPLDAKNALARIACHKKIHVPYVRPKALLELLTGAWEKEPGDTIADVLNSATRLAHENSDEWRSKWIEEDIEEQAGQMLYQNVYSLPPLTNDHMEQLGW